MNDFVKLDFADNIKSNVFNPGHLQLLTANRLFVSYLDHDGFVVLQDSTRVEVSRRRKEEVMLDLKAG